MATNYELLESIQEAATKLRLLHDPDLLDFKQLEEIDAALWALIEDQEEDGNEASR